MSVYLRCNYGDITIHRASFTLHSGTFLTNKFKSLIFDLWFIFSLKKCSLEWKRRLRVFFWSLSFVDNNLLYMEKYDVKLSSNTIKGRRIPSLDQRSRGTSGWTDRRTRGRFVALPWGRPVRSCWCRSRTEPGQSTATGRPCPSPACPPQRCHVFLKIIKVLKNWKLSLIDWLIVCLVLFVCLFSLGFLVPLETSCPPQICHIFLKIIKVLKTRFYWLIVCFFVYFLRVFFGSRSRHHVHPKYFILSFRNKFIENV